MKFELSRSRWFVGLGLTVFIARKELYIMLLFWLVIIAYGKIEGD